MGANILVVDDEQSIADLIEVYLKSENYNVMKFYNGRDALQCIEKESIDLALLDVMLPDVSGFFQSASRSGKSIISPSSC